MAPNDRSYSESHEWAKQDGDVVTIGLTDFAVEHLSDLTFVDLPSVGDAVEKGERFGEIESVKAVSELFSPVSGEVVEVNDVLADEIERVSQDPFEAGWMIRIKMAAGENLSSLMDSEAYAKHVASQSD